MKVAYFDCPTGLAGDMCLGALLDVGVPLDYVRSQLDRLGIAEEYRLSSQTMHHNGQRALKAIVEWRSPGGSFQVEDPMDEPGEGAEPSARSPEALGDHGHEHHEHGHEHHDHGHHEHEHHGHEHHDHGHEHHKHDDHDHSPDHHHHHDPHNHHTHHHSRRWPDIEAMLLNSSLPDRVVQWSRSIFWQLAQAEGAVHGIAPEQVQFHEVGAIDAIVDVVGTCLGLDWLGVERIFCSALPTGGGTVWAAHGRLPVPVPAVLKLFEMGQVPVYANGIDRELVTPTGAAIAVGLAQGFGSPPAMTLQRVGLGAGQRSLPLPNIMRLWLGELAAPAGLSAPLVRSAPLPPPIVPPPRSDRGPQSPAPGDRPEWSPQAAQPLTSGQVLAGRSGPALPGPESLASPHDPDLETVAVLETQIDDCSPQAIAYAIERLLQVGALDAFVQPVTMKKSRSGVAITVITPLDRFTACEDVLFQETTTIGIRRSFQQRRVLPRHLEVVDTDYGPVRVKVAWQDETRKTVQNVHPEFEDVAALARDRAISWLDIHRAAWIAWEQARRATEGDR